MQPSRFKYDVPAIGLDEATKRHSLKIHRGIEDHENVEMAHEKLRIRAETMEAAIREDTRTDPRAMNEGALAIVKSCLISLSAAEETLRSRGYKFLSRFAGGQAPAA